jgi:hypothetical protein
MARAQDEHARQLMARHLVELDANRVDLVDWLATESSTGETKARALRRFIQARLGLTGKPAITALDRLGKWGGYLVFFGVIRESETDGAVVWAVNRRHIDALQALGTNSSVTSLSKQARRDAFLEAYSKASRQIGTRLYLPISVLRDELGRILERSGTLLSDGQLDEIIRQAPLLLTQHLVAFSPFSGPARGGIQLPNMYAGFVSMRGKPKADTQDHE